ncbi:hypothetical protein [Acinetobacter larvae]|uniref:Uncharacterized protein n=1 Tax=Acinetobacter larvae TaxID=1789224 RepID=A0A1B2M3A1_9GAMM|nr:hypothetical protein [Acinetobacter larvae]AOA59677.1 hypothetical protein BFG52_15855 [Acinetobacter larvae]
MKTVSTKLLVLGFILPPILISILFIVIFVLATFSGLLGEPIQSFAQFISLFNTEQMTLFTKQIMSIVLFVLVTAGLQSVLYSIFMNFWILRKVQHKTNAIWSSAIFGGIAACIPFLLLGLILFSDRSTFSEIINFIFFLIIPLLFGMLIGLISGLILWKRNQAEKLARATVESR